ncbi:hypothetical protein QR680_003887 [Steinernema hermaphroditum]|uniref:Insulin-degrading enzyme n=1 Tax=Steinernema hermaphroditum TaxID=289476 RepID=A0AA39LT24_9BILA|nr:hypothetical protein QR680_003887 [Steinernema hermaphroditum]
MCAEDSSKTMPVPEAENVVSKRHENITKSPSDKREFRGLELSNGLKIVLVSDSEAEKCAASMDVNVGYMMDPEELPGLAHFCEHMLFMGTEKYPVENDYSSFIAKNGGSRNAFTSWEHTNFYFDIAADHFEGALDRFVQFFISPLFTESGTEREVKAVDSEFKNNENHDCRRQHRIQGWLCRPGHDYRKFGTGNRQTLMEIPKSKGIDVREELLKFHSKYYSSNIMSLCLVGNRSLDDLEKLALSLPLYQIPNKNVVPKVYEEHCYGPDELACRVDAVLIKDDHSVEFVFAVDDHDPLYKSKADLYVAHLTRLETKGSFNCELKQRGWSNRMYSYCHTPARGFAVFTVCVELSEEGLKHVENIAELLFNYINMMKKHGPQEWIYKEVAQLQETRFRFQEPGKALWSAVQRSSAVQTVPFEDILSHRHQMEKFDPELIEKLVEQLNPRNMIYFVHSKENSKLENLEKETYYNIEYKKTKLSEEMVERFERALATEHEAFYLPQKNPYIATKFDLKPRDDPKEDIPRIVEDNNFARVWYLQDDLFNLPKGGVEAFFTLPHVGADPVNLFMAKLFVKCFNHEAEEDLDRGMLAGLFSWLSANQRGLRLQFHGLDEKLPLLFTTILTKMSSYNAEEMVYKIMMEQIVRELKNKKKNQPHQHGRELLDDLLIDRKWSNAQLLAASEFVTLDRFNEFIRKIWEAVHIELLAYGNFTKEETTNLGNNAINVIQTSSASLRPLFSNELHIQRELKIAEGQSFFYDHEQDTHTNSCVEFLLQTGVQDKRSNMLLELFNQVSKEAAFDVLRTKEQLGYYVHSHARRSHGTRGLDVLVQGPNDPKYVEERIEAFLKNFRETLVEMSPEDYQKHVDALAVSRLEKPKYIRQCFQELWSEIDSRQYSFKRAEIEVEELRKITKEDLLQFYDEKIAAGSEKRQKISIRIYSTVKKGEGEEKKEASDEEQGGQKITDIESFKSGLPLYPRASAAIEVPVLGISL